MKNRFKIIMLGLFCVLALSNCQQKDLANTKPEGKTEETKKEAEQNTEDKTENKTEEKTENNTEQNTDTNNQEENKPAEEIDKDQLLEEIKTANEMIDNVDFDAFLDIMSNNNVKTKTNIQHMTGNVEYEPKSHNIKKATFQRESNDGFLVKFEFLGDKDHTFRQTTINTKTKNEDVKEQKHVNYKMYPDYYTLLDQIYMMKDDLVIEEKQDEYVMTLRSQNVDLLGIFQDSYSLNLKGVSQSEVKKDLEISFDKNTKYFKKIRLKFNYSGEKGKINMDIKTTYTNHKKTVI